MKTFVRLATLSVILWGGVGRGQLLPPAPQDQGPPAQQPGVIPQPGDQQQPGGVVQQPGVQQPGVQPLGTLPPQPLGGGDRLRANYVLGPGDQIMIRALDAEEISGTPFRVDGDGDVTLPTLGKLHAGGLSLEQFEALLTEKLKVYVRQPQVIVTVVQFRSEPVFLIGAFRAPGIYTLQGRRTLVEMLTMAGGLLPNAARRIKVTRKLEIGTIPLPTAVEDREKKISTVEISLGSLRDNVNPAEDIVLQPYDELRVERAEMVYVSGELGKVGGFELGERDSISVIQVLSMAGGLSKEALPDKAKILRPVMDSTRRAEIPINLRRVLAGQDNDFPLMANDLLYVPRKGGKRTALAKTALYALPLIPTVLYVVDRATR
jgi:polysaccharide biosynthesis/export protein